MAYRETLGGYGQFGSVAAAKRHYRRARTVKNFILEPCPKRAPRCQVCGQPVNDFSGTGPDGKPLHPRGYDGNRCEYLPKAKTVRAWHYTCRWDSALKQLFAMRHN